MRENVRVSNPYAPPEDRPRPPDGEPTDAPRAYDAPSWPPPAPRPEAVVAVQPEPPDPEAVALATKHARLFGVLILSSVLVGTLPLPWQAAALVFAVGAIGVGGWALVAAVRSRGRGLVPMLAVGSVVAVVWTLYLGVQLALWPVQQARQECLAGALTISATNACESQYEQEIRSRLDPGTTGS